MTSVLDLLINEISNVLGISPDEVKSRFTENELTELLNSSLCEPDSEAGPPFVNLSSLPCNDLNIPNLLPPESTDFLDELEKKADGLNKKDQKKCVDKVDEVNQIIEKQVEEYNQHKILLEKLIEYRDNYFILGIYFNERAKEISKFSKQFQPILEEIKRLEQQKVTISDSKTQVQNEISALINSVYDPVKYDSLNQRKLALEKELDNVKIKIEDQRTVLTQKEQTFSIFDNWYFKQIQYYSKVNENDPLISTYLRGFYTDYFNFSEFSRINDSLKSYSELISCWASVNSPSSIQEVLEKNFFKFKIEFTKLNTFTIDKQITNNETGESFTQTLNFPIKNNPLLKKNSFFESSSIFTLAEYNFRGDIPPSGRIYEQYYNLFRDPVTNFFTPAERGLTENANQIDPSLKGTGSEKKQENSRSYYIQNLELMQDFYNTFETRLEARKVEVRDRVITPSQEQLRIVMNKVATKEAQFILALSGINKRLPEDSSSLNSALKKIDEQNLKFSRGLLELDEEIARIKKRMEDLKPDPSKIKAMLKEKSPECFSKIDDEVADCGDTKLKLGSDPFFIKTMSGTDPTLPTQNQLCYWNEFSKVVNKIGLLPIPNVKGPPQLRYWPVGLVIPYPGGLIKIPLPIVWLPIITISTPLGNFVLFLTINGVFISPVLFFVSSTGFKQHVLTAKGPSEKFGYSAQDELLKSSIKLPLIVLVAKEKAERLAKEASLGKFSQFGEAKKQEILRAKSILDESMKIAEESGNLVKILQVVREINNFTEAFSGKGLFEISAESMDKGDSPIDAIVDAKRAVKQRLTEIGNAQMTAVNKLKEKIIKRQDQLIQDLKKSLEDGDTEKAKQIRQLLQSDGISLTDKVNSILDDMKTFYDKIKFPKIVIPKNTSTIDPKLNAIQEAIIQILQYTNVYGTQFFSVENLQVRNLVKIQLAKYDQPIRKKIREKIPSGDKIDIKKEYETIKSVFSDIANETIDFLTGKADFGSPEKIKAEIADLEKKLEKETDPVKRKRLQKKIETANQNLSLAFETNLFKTFLSISPIVLDSLNGISVDFDPFAPCCGKKPFELSLDPLSPGMLAVESVRALLISYIAALTLDDIIKLLGNRPKISADDLVSLLTAGLLLQIPESLIIPAPLNAISLIKSFSGLLISLFEPKAPNQAALPQLPAQIVIDLNILKAPLLELLINFLLSLLPDPNSAPDGSTQTSNTSTSSDNRVMPSSNSGSLVPKEISIIDCAPIEDTSPISNGTFSAEQIDKIKDLKKSASSSNINPSNVISNTDKFIFPAFQHLDIDFLNVNPSDLTAILINFIDLKFDLIISILDPFYKVLKIVKSTKGVNVNVLEDAFYKTPPYGTPAYAIFIAYTKALQLIPPSAFLSVIDTQLVKEKLESLEPVLKPIGQTAWITVPAAGAADSLLPIIKTLDIDSVNRTVSTKDQKLSTSALRMLHPLVSQDDLPPWERLSSKNFLFVLFVDQFISSAADKVGFFRSFV